MIYGLFGENTYMRSHALEALEANFNGKAEHVDGTVLTLGDLPDLLMATTLFDARRMIIIKNLSENDAVWSKLGDWLPRTAGTIDVVFIDTKPDRRTQTFKQLKALGRVEEFPSWDSKNESDAVKWLTRESESINLLVDASIARHIIQRVGFDQHQLSLALEKLLLSGKPISKDLIDELIEESVTAQAFTLFESFFDRDRVKANKIIDDLKLHEDPHRILGLLSSQVFQLAAISTASPDDDVAKDFAIHPFVVRKLTRLSKGLDRKALRCIVQSVSDADIMLKSSSVDPWMVIEKVATEISVATTS